MFGGNTKKVKIDADLFGERELRRFDELLLELESRAMELEDIQSLLPKEPPHDPKKRRGGFWNR